MPSDRHDERYSNKPRSTKHFSNTAGAIAAGPPARARSIPPPQAGKPTRPTRVSVGSAYPPPLPGIPAPTGTEQFSQAYRITRSNVLSERLTLRGKGRGGRVRSQKLARNLEEKSKGKHCHLENKGWVNFLRRHTSCLGSPPAKTHYVPQQ